MVEPIKYRPSAMPTYLDCTRRGAAQQLLTKEQKRAFGIGPDSQSAAAAIGTALHTLAAELLRIKQQFGDVTRREIADAMDTIRPSFDKEIAKGVLWDKTTPSEIAAYKQLDAMAAAFLPMIQRIEPLLIEQKFEALVSPLQGDLGLSDEEATAQGIIPVQIEGTLDCFDVRSVLWDHKTGAQFPACHAQMGTYLILLELNGHKPQGSRVNYCPRLGHTKLDELQPRFVVLNADECVNAAWAAIRELQTHYRRWLRTGEPWSFPANPMSRLCTPNYCNAYKTGFCQVGGCGEP